MKTKILFIIICNLLICNLQFSQSINLTLGSGGVFTLKDASTNYFTLSQSTGQVNILNNLRLENTTSSTTGVIYKGVDRFIHNYGTNNTFLGVTSGNFTMTGGNNTAVGMEALISNTTGQNNTAIGSGSLYNNTTGDFNTTLGVYSLQSNISGIGNTSVGLFSLPFNITGNDNTSVGINSLYSNTTGNNNTAIGSGSLSLNATGNNNIAIGYSAQVPSGTSSNQVRIGDSFITYAGIQVPWTITSDRRWKSDIQNSSLGLEFISKLSPVSYFRNNDDSKKTEYGFIAQEVEEVLKESGTENTGMITITDEGMYELRYNDLLAPMVKAVQELNEKCSTLEAENSQLKNEVESLKEMKVKLAELEQSQLKLMMLINSNNRNENQSVKISDNK